MYRKGDKDRCFAGGAKNGENDMYKKQMILQRIVCYLQLIASALVFIYSLGLLTDLYDNKFNYYAENLEKPQVAGTEIYYYMQEFNQNLTAVGIILILLAVSLFVFRNNVRRKYYIANYITVAVNTIASIAASVWALNNVFIYRAQYLLVDFVELKKRSEMFGFSYTESTFWFDISVVVFGLLLVVTALNVANLIFKVVLMKSEKQLLEAGKEA